MQHAFTRITAIGAGLLLSVVPAPFASAQAETEEAPPPEFRRPSFIFLRQNEDWSVMRDAAPEELTDPWDALKFVPLSEDESVWASFGGSARLRVEVWDNFAFGAPRDDNETFLLSRFLLHADVHIGENLRGFIQGKSAWSTDRDLPGGRRPLDVDSIDLEQGFVDVRFPLKDDLSITLRPGRQALLFGKQRLVSPLGWSNTLRRWDGVNVITKCKGWKIEAFWTQFAPVQKYEFNDPDAQTQFFGVYATGKVPDSTIGLDLYWLALDRDDPITFNGTTGEEERYTVGGRVFGKIPWANADYDFEGAYQYGEVGSSDVDAFMIGSELGFKLAEVWSAPRLHIGFDYGSGDDRAGGDVETFNQLFPLGHAYLGYIDIVGRQNIVDLNIGAKCTPFKKASFSVAGHLFWRAEDTDALYNAGGGVVRAGNLGGSSEVGQELDLLFTYRFDRHLLAKLGYSHFFPGDFIDESGRSDDINFAYASLEYTF